MYLGTMVDDMFLDTPQFEFGARGQVTLDSEGNLPFDSVGTDANDGENVSVHTTYQRRAKILSRQGRSNNTIYRSPGNFFVAVVSNGNRVVWVSFIC